MKIEVTKQCIDSGIPNNAKQCPVSLAIKKAIPGSNPISGMYYLRYTVNGKRYEVKTPESITDFMKRFDLLNRGEPFDFELDQITSTCLGSAT